ncbi:MAG: recombination protein NinG [Sphingobacteriaceae bacterium]|nr:recombination protein NinG [Sphingobacteriaceae bacterium]
MVSVLNLTAKVIQKYKKESVSKLIKLAEKHFNAYIRLRDDRGGYFVCISCNSTKAITTAYHAGHYLSAGHHSYHRFNELNVHGQCLRCNCHLHGNLIPYRTNLVKKIGEQAVLELESTKNLSIKWDRLDLIAIIETYKSKLKQAA